MKKITCLCLFLLFAVKLTAQNVQIHYDFGHNINPELLKDRPVTTTVEMFKPDKLGSTFFFVDMDYTSKGVQMAYWEIAREFNLGKSPFAAHIEYNGGLCSKGSFGNSYLLGAAYNYNNSDFTKGFSIQTMYKYIQSNPNPHNLQLTTVWYAHFANRKFSINGFADFWSTSLVKERGFVFLSEPQFWINLNAFDIIPKDCNLSIGSEIELSYNFYFDKKFYANPTLAVKWTF